VIVAHSSYSVKWEERAFGMTNSGNVARFFVVLVTSAKDLTPEDVARAVEANDRLKCRVAMVREMSRNPLVPCRFCKQDISASCLTLMIGYARNPQTPDAEPTEVVRLLAPPRCPFCESPFIVVGADAVPGAGPTVVPSGGVPPSGKVVAMPQRLRVWKPPA